MKIKRLFIGVGLLGVAFAITLWLVRRGSETSESDVKAPPSSLAFKSTAGMPPREIPEEDKENASTPPGIEALFGTKGQRLHDMMAGGGLIKRPSDATVELYLQQHTRSAASLLTAWQTTDNLDYLREAATRFENDSHVQFAVLASDAFPDDRSKWIALFKQSSPYDAMPNYFAAHEYFRQNQTDQAVAEMLAGASKQKLDDYSTASLREREELFLAAGASPVEAAGEAFTVAVPTLQSCLEAMNTLAQEASSAQAAYAAAGDSVSAQKVAQAGFTFGQQLSVTGAGRLLISQLAGIDIEQTFLKQLPPDEHVDWLGQSPSVRLAELQQRKEQLEALSAASRSALAQSNDAELSDYLDRVKQFGQPEAMQWLVSRKQNP